MCACVAPVIEYWEGVCRGNLLFDGTALGCTDIEGDLGIVGLSTATLAPLAQVTSIGGSLHIASNIGLTDLSGLDSLTWIGGTLTIAANTALQSLHGLGALRAVGGVRSQV